MTAKQLVWIGVATTTVGTILATVILSVVGHLGDVVRWIAGAAADTWNVVWAVLGTGVPLWLLAVAVLGYLFVKRTVGRRGLTDEPVDPTGQDARAVNTEDYYQPETLEDDAHRLWEGPPEREPTGTLEYGGYTGIESSLDPSPLQVRIFVLLARADGGSLTYEQLALESITTQLRISQAVDQLEQAHLVFKYDHFDPPQVELSPDGRDFVIQHRLDSPVSPAVKDTVQKPAEAAQQKPDESDDQEKRLKYRRAVSYLDDLVEFRHRWAKFEERLLALIELFDDGYDESEEFDELCDKLATDREWLKTQLINLLRDRPDIEGSSAEISNAERELLQHDFRRGSMCRRFFENYHRFNELEGVDWYELDQPRQVVHDAALALDAAIQRLDREAEELSEEARIPGEAPYRSRVQ